MNSKLLALAVLFTAMHPIVHPPVAEAAEQETTCASTGVADAGYQLVVAADLKTAVLSEESIAGPRKVADLDCQLQPVKHFPDALNNYLTCRDARAPMNGLMVRLYEGGIAGLHTANVLQAFDGAESAVQFGNLNCR